MSEPGATAKRGLPDRVKMRHGPHFVDELSRRHEAPVGKMVGMADVRPNPKQPRSHLGDLSDLVASVRGKGILEPLLVRRVAADRGFGYEIIAGERRYRAALEAGLVEIPVIELEVSETEALEIALVENLQRKDLTPFEEADGFLALQAAHGFTQEEIAQAIGRSRSAVAESLVLVQVPPRVRDAAMALGVTAKSTLLELLKAKSEPAMLELLDRVARQGLSRDDVRRETRGGKGRSPRSRTAKRPYTFKFRSPDRTFQLALSFRQSLVEKQDLIRALEQILEEVRQSPDR